MPKKKRKVFISYRRGDGAQVVSRLRDLLSSEGIVTFVDQSSIQPGQDWEQVLRRSLELCDGVLAVIGPCWLSGSPGAKSRVTDERDWVRFEITEALRKNLWVVPVLVGGAELPKADELPPEMRRMLNIQAFELGNPSGYFFDANVAELARHIKAGDIGLIGPRLPFESTEDKQARLLEEWTMATGHTYSSLIYIKAGLILASIIAAFVSYKVFELSDEDSIFLVWFVALNIILWLPIERIWR